MNDDELTRGLERGMQQRVRHLAPRPDVDELLARSERRRVRQRGGWIAALVVALLVGGAGGYLWADARDSSTNPSIAVLNDGVRGDDGSSAEYEPVDVAGARNQIEAAFHAAFDGDVPLAERLAAIQDGPSLRNLLIAAAKNALSYGYTREQLAGARVAVAGVKFIDATHAVVQFTLTIPGHGDVLRDRVGYAVIDENRWKVSLRTECDLLSLNGLQMPCPPAP